ncbi:MAG: hypothetical protein DYH06_10460, partial [Acidobacteria bacterium ACB2]|nr:hypothetical protein [Acidobacteria bacterium ACB2]
RAVTFWLDPDEPPAELRPEAVRARTGPGLLLLHGHVADGGSLLPLPGVRVSLARAGLSAVTDERGYFAIRVSLSGRVDRPGQDDLVLEREGFVTRVERRTLLPEGDVHLLVDLAPGAGREEVDARHRLLEAEEEAPPLPPSPHAPSAPAPEDAASVLALPSPDVLTPVAPPASIRVGTSCSCTTCSGVSVMSLETYVKRGLNDEWISSWASHSLAAGAIAYRSYGSYYALHPISGSYDICSTTCCQVYTSSTTTATDAAAAETAGILLLRSGSVFRSEYSAENNSLLGALSCVNSDLSCGDGSAGSPAAGWPCLSDSVCAGQSCFGHGRGMCQWGTQRWASGQSQLWPWITDHYYNANGSPSGTRSATMTSPIRLTSVAPSPAQVSAGGTFTIDVGAANDAETTHARVYAGASLYRSGVGWVSDPPHDANVPLSPGANAVSRLFTVPAGTPDGTYDLVVALWLDASAGGTIGSGDLALVSTTLAGAVEVGCTASDATPPSVTPPSPVTVDQTICCGASGGATAATSPSLSAFLSGGSATDGCDPSPERLAPQVGASDVTASTCFPAGTTEVAFRYRDAAGNVGTAAASATVRTYGDLNLDLAVDTADMVVLQSYFNFAATPGLPPFAAPEHLADLTHDGPVDPADMVVLQSYFNFAVACLAP